MNRVAVVSPVRNEERFLTETIESVLAQDLRPLEWVIVDDGSTDRTAAIARAYARRYDWIRCTSRLDQGCNRVGKGVAENFNVGMRHLSPNDWDFVVKLDGDVVLPTHYFSTLTTVFAKEKRVGILSGTQYAPVKGKFMEERMPDDLPVGLARMYRRHCFLQIGGVAEVLGWDTVDVIRAQMAGWITRRLSSLRVFHLRTMSSRDGLWDGKKRIGRTFHGLGYHPAYILGRSIYRMSQHHGFIESIAVIAGYLLACARRDPLVVTQDEKRFVRRRSLEGCLRSLTVWRSTCSRRREGRRSTLSRVRRRS